MPLSNYNPNDGHIYPISLAIASIIASVIGIIFNLLIIIVIWKTKALHNRCYVLIAYLAVVNLICSIYYTALRILIFNYVYFMTNYDCFLFSFVGLFAQNTQTGLTVILGVDRLVAVLCPTKYRHVSSSFYLFTLLFPVNVFAFCITGYGWIDARSDVKAPICLPPTAYNTSARQVWTISHFIVIFVVIFVYLGVHYKLKRSQVSQNDATIKLTAKIIKALYAILFVFLGTWAVTYISMALITFIVTNPSIISVIEKMLVWPVIINAGSSFLMYFYFSYDFRMAVIRLIRRQPNNNFIKASTSISQGTAARRNTSPKF